MVQSQAVELAKSASPTVRRQSAAGRNKMVIGGAVVVLALVYLVFTSMQGTTMYYLTVGELLDRGAEAYAQQVRVGAKVQRGSIQSDPKIMTVRFVALDDKDPQRTVRVVYKGVVPDTFKDDADAVFEGRMNPEGIFQANVLLAKCPSKYEADTGTAEHDQQH